MDFALSEDQEQFRGTIRKYLNNKGNTNIARAFIDGETDLAGKVAEGLSELGCTAIPVSEAYDGLELGPLDLVPFYEEIGRVLLPGIQLEMLSLFVPLLEKYGTEEQKKKYLPDIAAGAITATLAWSEPGTGYHVNEIDCEAAANGDKLVINGTKSLVPHGETADVLLTVLRTSEGISLVLIDRSDAIQSRKLQAMDETQRLAELTFSDLAVPVSQVLGSPGDGWRILQEGLLTLNASLSSMMVGAMDEIVSMAAEYAKIRVQFNQPIGRFQAVKHRIVNMKLDLETARSLSYYANWAVENNSEDQEAAVYSARSFITNAYSKLAADNIQVHGGIGFTEEMDCHLYLKRAKYYANYLGSVRDAREKTANGLQWEGEAKQCHAVSV